jgi:thiol-disulfide isomerase/thioredoxin
MPTKRQFLYATLATAALAAGAYVSWRQQPMNTLKTALWDISLQNLNGQAFDLKRFRGRPLLLNFWASWCAPCLEEMPLLDGFYQQNTSNGFQLLGIAADKPDAVARFLAKSPVQFPIALAGFEGIALSQSLGNTAGGLPFTALLDAKGALLFTKSGQLTTNDLRTITHLMNLASR